MNLFLRKVVPVITFLFITGIASTSNAQLSFSNPLLDFDSIICVARGETVIDHVCDQYIGCYALSGGSVYIISGFKGNSRKVTDLLANATVSKGRYTGRKLTGGSFISPELSYDGKTVLFGWKVGSTGHGTGNPSWSQDECFHIFKINIDGTNLVQLTDGTWNDFDPCYLPSGRIAFISERRGGYGRCHLRYVPTYTLYSMKDDGSDIICLSYHETNEWHPSVDNNGMLVYSRWDYVDRDDCIAHHMWICYPDGRDPRSWHGNYPLALTTMEGSNWPDGRNLRPWSEFNVRAIPNSTKYVATASGHHTQSFGELIIIDLNVRDDSKMSQITNITSKNITWGDNTGTNWATPYPLSENYYLASKDGDIVFLDKTGARITVCPKSATPAANIANLKLIDPIPVKPRTVPTDIPVQTFEGERATISHSPATISVLNVYEGDMPLPTGTKIKWIRVIQLIPKSTPFINQPQVCAGSESLVRMPLGIAPVETDGSAYFEAPVDRSLYFQLLDSNYMAVQSMRSLTYAHKGERLSCTGCHEDKWKTTPSLNPSALKRAPSKLQTEFQEALPVGFYRLAKPVLDAKCASCHTQQKAIDLTYNNLKPYIFHFCDGGWPYTNGNITAPQVGGSRSLPGKVGARIAKLYTTYCKPSHHNVSLTADELHKITLWLDCNSNELGSEQKVSDQTSGKLVWPSLDVDTLNLLGVEKSTVSIGQVPVTARVAEMPYTIRTVSGLLKLEGSCVRDHRVELFNANGRRLAVFSGTGNLHYSIPMNSIPTGMVILRMVVDGKKYAEKVPVMGK